MTEQDVRDLFDALSRGDLEAAGRHLHENATLLFPGRRFGGRFEGRRRVLAFFRANRRLFREPLRFDLDWVAPCGERFVAAWTNSATTRDGRPYANRGVTVVSVAHGRVIELDDHLDTERMAETWPAAGAARER